MDTTLFEDAKKLWLMKYADEAFLHAKNACDHIITTSLERSSSIYYSLVTSMYVSYARPFGNNKLVGKFPKGLVPSEFRSLHEELLLHRNQLMAHLDGKSFSFADYGSANQVRFVSDGKAVILISFSVSPAPEMLVKVSSLCGKLREKTGYHIERLFKKHKHAIPHKAGEYTLNIYEPTGDFAIRSEREFYGRNQV